MASYETSSQCLKWTFKKQVLDELREKNHLDALNRIKASFSKIIGSGTPSISPVTPATGLANTLGGLDPFRSPEALMPSPNLNISTPISELNDNILKIPEEAMWKAYIESKLQKQCDSLKLMPHVMATAVSYFKRFYLRHSVIEHDTFVVMVSCIFLATKVEEQTYCKSDQGEGGAALTADDITHALLSEKEYGLKHIIDMEKLLLSGLDYHLIVYHPYRPLRGLFHKLSKLSDMEFLNIARYQVLFDSAMNSIRHSLRSECMLVYYPGEIALAALKAAATHNDDAESLKEIESLINSEYKDNQEFLLSRLDAINTAIEKSRKFEHEVDSKVKKRLKKLKQLQKRIEICRKDLSQCNSQLLSSSYKRKRSTNGLVEIKTSSESSSVKRQRTKSHQQGK